MPFVESRGVREKINYSNLLAAYDIYIYLLNENIRLVCRRSMLYAAENVGKRTRLLREVQIIASLYILLITQ